MRAASLLVPLLLLAGCAAQERPPATAASDACTFPDIALAGGNQSLKIHVSNDDNIDAQVCVVVLAENGGAGDPVAYAAIPTQAKNVHPNVESVSTRGIAGERFIAFASLAGQAKTSSEVRFEAAPEHFLVVTLAEEGDVLLRHETEPPGFD